MRFGNAPQTRPVPLWKQACDLLLGSAALVLLSPVMLIVAILVRLALGKPVLFRQRRPGLAGDPFIIYKFRTLRSPKPGVAETDAERISTVGRVLRRTSLDELPELWNVLRGDMSLVGPRPLLMQYLERYTPGQRRRHEVLPGITGWAQVNGRNAISWEERFALDVWYVDHQSFWLDTKILALTVIRGLIGKGVNHGGHATMPEFIGTKAEDLTGQYRSR